jgi:hypothetical protein
MWLARQIGNIVHGMTPDGVVTDDTALMATLNCYADILEPWAKSVAGRMIRDVSRRDVTAWEASVAPRNPVATPFIDFFN